VRWAMLSSKTGAAEIAGWASSASKPARQKKRKPEKVRTVAVCFARKNGKMNSAHY
jgi:hypothetical protein